MAEFIETTNQIKQFVLYTVISLYFWFMSKRPPSFPQPSLRSGFGPRTSRPWQRAAAKIESPWSPWILSSSKYCQAISGDSIIFYCHGLSGAWSYQYVCLSGYDMGYMMIFIYNNMGYMEYVMIFMYNNMIFSNPYHQIRPTWSASPRLAAK
jgi:hypothetical protein